MSRKDKHDKAHINHLSQNLDTIENVRNSLVCKGDGCLLMEVDAPKEIIRIRVYTSEFYRQRTKR